MFATRKDEDDQKADSEKSIKDDNDGDKKNDSKEIELCVIYGRNKYDVRISLDQSVIDLKKKVENLTGVPTSLQKLVAKGTLQDGMTLRQCKLVKGQKVMLIGSKPTDVISANTKPNQQEVNEEAAKPNKKEPWCRQKHHLKVLEKGVPDDAMPGIKNTKDPLPQVPITGMLNKSGGKVQLCFKLELDQVWILSEDRTQKVPMNNIQDVVSEPVDGQEEYHILALQLGSSEQSRLYFYWFPAQYVNAIRKTILG